MLNSQKIRKLHELKLDAILVSMYDGPKQIKHFEEMIKKSGVGNKFVILRKRYLPEEQDFGITMSNRGGMLKNAEHSILPASKVLKERCFYPSYKFFLDYNGVVLMCSHDWGKKNILGNLI